MTTRTKITAKKAAPAKKAAVTTKRVKKTKVKRTTIPKRKNTSDSIMINGMSIYCDSRSITCNNVVITW